LIFRESRILQFFKRFVECVNRNQSVNDFFG
jgi:hypothetical protein